MSENERMDRAVALLEEQLADERPAIVSTWPETGHYLRGNRGGFVRLALACLKAARGEKQDFRKEDWIHFTDLDWEVRGLEYDESAHADLAEIQRVPPWKRRLRNGIPLLLLVVILGLSLIGFIALLRFALLHF